MDTIYLDTFYPLYSHSEFANRPLEIEVLASNECPICGYAMDFNEDCYRNFHDLNTNKQKEFKVFSLRICPHCHKGFVIEYTIENNGSNFKEKSQKSYPYSISEIRKEKEICDISSDFYDIYGQCLTAKKAGLFHLYGLGLRKALEFLVKDYALNLKKIPKDKLIKKNLHNCITEYFNSSPEIQDIAIACKMIGNNETHWNNQNTSEDIILMEKLIRILTQEIIKEVNVKQARNIIGKNAPNC